jgi:hypothetical protein
MASWGGCPLWPSRIDDDLASRTTEKDLKAVEYIPPEDSLLTREVCLKLAGILLAIQPDPGREANCRRSGAAHPAHQAGNAHGGIEVQLLAIGPGQDAHVCTGVRDDPIQNQVRRAA